MASDEHGTDQHGDTSGEQASIAAQVLPRHAGPGRRSALLGLIALLLCVLAAVVTATAYLLRDNVGAQATVTPPTIHPFSLFYVQRGQIYARAGATVRHVGPMPAEAAGDAGRLLPAPNGSMALVLGPTRAWLVVPGGNARPLPGAPAAEGAGAWRYVDATWTGTHSFALLLEGSGAGGTKGLVARYSVGTLRPSWQLLRAGSSRLLSLSPDASEIALLDTLGGRDAFASQYAVELRDIAASHRSVAYRYIGGQPVDALAWSPDRGTVVAELPAGGLAIQKSSGRPVLQAPTGAFPVAFSDSLHARLAYVTSDRGRRQIHILSLHGERDTTLDPPVQQAPRALAWTPDARAILYATSTGIWQIAADGGTPTRLVAGVGIDQVGTAPASAALAR